MSEWDADVQPVIVALRAAAETHELSGIESLLAEDVRWGDDDGDPRTCHSRGDVLAMLAKGIAAGGTATVTELLAGPSGVLCGLLVRWPAGSGRLTERQRYQAYLVRDGRIVEIRPHDDRASAAEDVGLGDPAGTSGPALVPPAR